MNFLGAAVGTEHLFADAEAENRVDLFPAPGAFWFVLCPVCVHKRVSEQRSMTLLDVKEKKIWFLFCV